MLNGDVLWIVLGFIVSSSYLLCCDGLEVPNCPALAMHGSRWVKARNGTYEHANEIIENLWIGSACIAADSQWLREHEIKYVMNMASEWHRLPGLDSGVVGWVSWGIDDSLEDSNARSAQEALYWTGRIIERWKTQSGATLVHCNLGISRSTTAVAAYLQQHHNMSCDEAVALIQRKRAVAAPNQRFLKLLGCTQSLIIEL